MLTLSHLGKTYADGTRALSDINLEIRDGEIAALIGGSGCGKTTLLRLAAGLDHATGGTISLDGETISGPHPAVAVVFQEPRLLPWLSVADNVGFGIDHLPRAERDARITHALERIGLAEHAGRWPRDLSGGQQQRVAIARALVTRPKLLLLDEPFSALDAFTRASLHGALLDLWEDVRPIVLMVTHDVSEAVTLADRAFVMRARPGRIHDELPITLARPRQQTRTGFEQDVRRLLEALDEARQPPQTEHAAQAAGHWW
jgi:sulfonate transport system ATP-binding protein